MKSYTLTPSYTSFSTYTNQRFASVRITGATFDNSQLVIEERHDDGSWALVPGVPVVTNDTDWFVVKPSQIGARLRFSVLGSGSYTIPIEVSQEPVATSDYYVPSLDGETAHTHANKTILDNTTGTFTTARETKLDSHPLTAPHALSDVAGVLTLDRSLGVNATHVMAADITDFTVTNADVGDSGLLELSYSLLGATFTANASSIVLSGDLADVATLDAPTPNITIGFYKFGAGDGDLFLYVSDVA